MANIAPNILALIGNTPLVKINNLSVAIRAQHQGTQILAKLEYFNPGGSVKDRAALFMIEEAERQGKIKKGDTLIEPTSGNTGLGLALVAKLKGYQLILTMPETMSLERRMLLEARGAKLVLTPGNLGMAGAINKAQELLDTIPNAMILQQFENEANPLAHEKTTAQEILRDTDNKVDILVAGVGTGGTISGIAKVLKAHNQDIKIIAVEPASSPVLSGGKAGPHKIQGIGAGFEPKNFKREYVDEIMAISNEVAMQTSRDLAQEEGMLVGISSGAAMAAALDIAMRPQSKDKNIVVILPDTGERYLSTELFKK